VRFVRAVATLTLALAAACSGGGKAGGTFAVPRPTRASTLEQQAEKTVAPGRLHAPSPARMFSGTASALGELTRYCVGSTCEESDPHTPTYLPGAAGTFVLFTIGETPLDARAEVRGRPSERPATVTLTPGSLMVFNHGLLQGRYLVDLFVRWKGSEARWRFGLNVR